MLLWTIQSPEGIASLERDGVLIATPDGLDLLDETFRPAYRWMAEQMALRVGPGPAPATYPIWAWHTWCGRRGAPDLRSTGHLPRGSRGARVEFAVPDAAALLSDFSLWHYVLNYWYLPASSADGEAFEAELKAAGLDFHTTKPLPDPVFHSRVQRSWDRIFDLGLAIEGLTDKPTERSIQATLWCLPKNCVRRVTWFRAR